MVGAVVLKEDASLRVDEDHLGGGGAGVDTQVGRAGVGGQVQPGHGHGLVTGGEGLVLSLRGEEGLHGVHGGGHVGRVFQQVQDLLKGAGLARLGAQGGTDGGKAVPILGEDGVVAVQVEGVHEPLPQALEEVEGAA